MNPDQYRQLTELLLKVSEAKAATGFDWIQGALALGATLVSVTGVVVGMRSAISSMARQLDQQSTAVDNLREEISQMREALAVMRYAMGIEDERLNKAK